MANAIREVGACNCVEHQASDRLRQIAKELKERVLEAEAIIKGLQEDLFYWKEGGNADVDEDGPGNRGNPNAVGGGDLEDRSVGEGGSREQGKGLRLYGVQK
jgi:hypothetical protein